MKDFVRRARSTTQAAASSEPVLSVQAPLTSPRMSILPSVRIPLLRRQDSEDPPSNKKPPLLALKLSSRSFLDCVITSDKSEEPLYEISTSGTSTSISRADPKHVFVKAASVKWPRVLPTKTTGRESTDGVLLQLRGSRWNNGDSLLRPPTAPHAPRKFNIPNFSQSLKWKRYGTVYWCTTTSVKGPIAVLETTTGTKPTQLTFYETLHDKYDTNALSAFQGVSILLLDYVLVTALLLVTDVQDWMLVQKYEGTISDAPSLPSNAAGSSSMDQSLTSDPQLRKIMYGEPIFPKLSRSDLRLKESKSKHSSSSTSPTTPGPPRTPPSTSSGRPLVAYEESETSSLRAPSPKQTLASIMSSDTEYDDSFSMSDARSTSPLAESVHFSSAPHMHNDPSFYVSSKRPPVPPLPFQYRSHNSRISASRPVTPTSATSRTFRNLPSSPTTESTPRIRMPPPEEPTSLDETIEHALQNPRTGRASSVRSLASNMSQSRSGARRPLPRPPPVPPISTIPPMVKRAQSSNQLRDEYSLSKPVLAPSARPQRSLPVPPTPLVIHTSGDGASTGSNTPLTPTQQQHSRRPPIAKTSQEDLSWVVHSLMTPQRDLPPPPLPSTSIYDVPPPAYETINFSNESRRKQSTRSRTNNPRS